MVWVRQEKSLMREEDKTELLEIHVRAHSRLGIYSLQTQSRVSVDTSVSPNPITHTNRV